MNGASFTLQTSRLLPDRALHEPESLRSVLSELCTDKPQGKVSLILESAWLPVLLADTGGALPGTNEVEALMRYRLNGYHGAQGDDLSGWDVRADYRAGDRFALGYGLAPRVKQVLLEATEQAGLRLDTLTPAFVWGWQRLRPTGRTGWWLWPEQDRLLLARIEAGNLVALNPAVPLTEGGAAIERAVQIEAARSGLPASGDGVTVGSWLPPVQLPARSERLVWRSVVGAP